MSELRDAAESLVLALDASFKEAFTAMYQAGYTTLPVTPTGAKAYEALERLRQELGRAPSSSNEAYEACAKLRDMGYEWDELNERWRPIHIMSDDQQIA